MVKIEASYTLRAKGPRPLLHRARPDLYPKCPDLHPMCPDLYHVSRYAPMS